MKKIYRSKKNKVIAGVCGGIGEALNIDPSIVRVIFALLLLPGGLPGVLPYVILWVVLPINPGVNKKDVIDV